MDFCNLEQAPKGFIREEKTNGIFANGKKVNIKIYHALFLRERKACMTNEQAVAWINKRRLVWMEKSSKENAICSMRISIKTAKKKASDALFQYRNFLSPEQAESVRRALAVLSETADSLM